ncbi:hypothetical protein CAPTEDRAFT_199130 [Capitella teleta]|uniref:G-protein coupled receptors family 1 profile domain-containing protein n=1 Tax=Capitella teleta TaxID=283909 RepID=R7V672_CAPTE|nr:hypothetical protein CAPTEDRAFT_199130 [Capitella teleta]|eukprot:ELU13977.1 hypothetical protein CAPTEDRAFT_199130 [Capitella teleta]
MSGSNSSSTVFGLKTVGFQFYSIHASFFCVESLIIMIINPLAVYLIATNKVLNRSSTNVLIVSACIADSMYGISVLFYESTLLPAIKGFTGQYISLGNRISYAFATQSMMGSLLTTMYIAIERGIATYRPLNYRQWVTPRRAACAVAATWLYLFVVVPPLAVVQFFLLPEDRKQSLADEIKDVFPPLVFRCYISLHLYIPLAVSIVAYIGISRAVYKQTRSMRVFNGSKNKEEKAQKQSLKVTKMSMLLLGLLLITWTPFAITNILIPFPDSVLERDKFRHQKMASSSSVLLVSAYSFINIIVYTYNHKDFRTVIAAKMAKYSGRVFTVTNEIDTTSTVAA